LQSGHSTPLSTHSGQSIFSEADTKSRRTGHSKHPQSMSPSAPVGSPCQISVSLLTVHGRRHGRPQGTRNIEAILAADVAGYSRLMQEDDEATVATLEAYRTVFREKILCRLRFSCIATGASGGG